MPKIDNKYDFWNYIKAQEKSKDLYRSTKARYYSQY